MRIHYGWISFCSKEIKGKLLENPLGIKWGKSWCNSNQGCHEGSGFSPAIMNVFHHDLGRGGLLFHFSHDSVQDCSSMGSSYNLMIFWLKISMPWSADEISQNNRQRMWHNFLFLNSFVISSSYFEPGNWHIFLLLYFSFRKDLVHYAAQILVTPKLFRHSAADIPLPLVWSITLP